MARPIHQLIAQSRGPDLMGAQAGAMQQLAAMQGMKGAQEDRSMRKDQYQRQIAQQDTAARDAKQAKGMEIMAGAALQLEKVPPEQRAAAYQRLRNTASLYWEGEQPWPEEYTPEVQSMLDFAKAQKFGAAEHEATLGAGAADPSAVREYEFYQNLPDDQKREFLRVKRSSQMLDIGGGGKADITAGAPETVIAPEVATGRDAARAGAMTTAQEQAKTEEILPRAQVERQAEGQAELPQAEIEANEAIRLVDELLDHPGFGYAVGKSSVLPVIPGSDASDFIARLDQMKGKQFLQAYQSLKGGGQITEVEGKKAEDAISRMKTSQSEPEFKKAARDFQELIRNGLKRDRKKAGAEVADDDIQSLIDKYAD